MSWFKFGTRLKTFQLERRIAQLESESVIFKNDVWILKNRAKFKTNDVAYFRRYIGKCKIDPVKAIVVEEQLVKCDSGIISERRYLLIVEGRTINKLEYELSANPNDL